MYRTRSPTALVAHPESQSVNPFMVINELDSGLKHHSPGHNGEINARDIVS